MLFRYSCLFLLATGLVSGLIGTLVLEEGSLSYQILRIASNASFVAVAAICIVTAARPPITKVYQAVRWQILRMNNDGPRRNWGSPLIYVGIVVVLVAMINELKDDAPSWKIIYSLATAVAGLAVIGIGWLINHINLGRKRSIDV